MARSLTLTHENLQDDDYRLPDFYIEIYDLWTDRNEPDAPTINRVVQGDPNLTPINMTPFVLNVSMVERSSDFVQGSLQGNSISFSVVDRNLRFDPVDGSEPQWLKAGNTVRIREGDGRSQQIDNETFNGDDVGVGGTYSLNGRDVVDEDALTVREGSAGGTLLVKDTDYTVDPIAGTITGLGSKWVAATDYFVSYEARIVPIQDWPFTFTGSITGQAGSEPRDRAGSQVLQASAIDRLAIYLGTNTTSQAFPQGTTYQDMMRSILEDEVGLDQSEFDLGTIGNNELTSQATTQLVDESPMISVTKIAFVFGFIPRFDGEGILRLASNLSSKGSSVNYPNPNPFEGFSRPFSPLEVPNEVEVLGLSAVLTRVDQPRQVLARASTTLGFFGGDERIRVDFSDDSTQQAEDTDLNVISSVTGALIPFGAEDYTPTLDDDGGSRGGVIDVESAFYAPLITSLYAGRLAAAAIPDAWAGIGGGNTIPIGRLVEGAAAIAIATIQGTIGRGQYEIVGTPYEYVFQEIRRVARVANTKTIDRRTLTIENHLIDNDSGDEVQDVANRELRNVRKRANVRNVRMRHDLRLEPYDKFAVQLDQDTSKDYIITQISRTISRDPDQQVAALSLYETTLGIWP